MNTRLVKLLTKRQHLLRKLASLRLLTQASYLERFSTCARKHCACHQGQKHGPRSYVVVYRDGKQRQVYVPRDQLPAVRKGVRQNDQALGLLRQITDINLALMRAGVLDQSLVAEEQEGDTP